jgi:hypothetical protein
MTNFEWLSTVFSPGRIQERACESRGRSLAREQRAGVAVAGVRTGETPVPLLAA